MGEAAKKQDEQTSSMIVTMTQEQLRALVKDAVSAALANTNGAHAEFLTLKETAAMMRVSERAVRNWVRDLGLPALRAGADYRFRRESVVSWLETQSVRPGAHVSKHVERLTRVTKRGV